MLVIGGVNEKSDSVGTGTAVGTCGELVQGFTSSGAPFHVTLPVEKTATVTVALRRSDSFSVSQVGPQHSKLEKSLLATATYLGIEPCEIRVAHWTDLEVGKGMGSSTADIVAASRALGNAVGRDLNAAELAAIAVGIESSDGSMYPGIVAFNQRKGLIHRFAWYPQFLVVVLANPIKRFNTESAQFDGKARHGAEFDAMLASLKVASTERDVSVFARAATRSAQLNQRYVPNPYFALLEERFEDLGALGINVGHTGTVSGLLFDADDPTAMRNASAACVELQGLFSNIDVEMSLTPAMRTDSAA